MKKVSTATRCEFGKFAGQRLTIGLDLGDRSSWYCILDEQGELLLEQKVATTPKAMKEVFGAMPRSRIAHGPDQYGPRADEVVWRAPARLQPAEDERRTGPRAEPGVAECLATLAGGNRIAQRAHP